MSTKREQILAALHAHLTTAVPSLTILRNPALADIIGGKAVGQRDGDIELTDEFLNGPIYEWTMTPTVTIVFEKGQGDVDAAVDGAVDLIALAIEVAGDLGGLVTRVECRPPTTEMQEIFGSADLKGADLPIEIDYWTDRPVG